MAVLGTHAHHLGQLAVKIYAQAQIRISDGSHLPVTSRRIEKIGQTQRQCVSRALLDSTVAGHLPRLSRPPCRPVDRALEPASRDASSCSRRHSSDPRSCEASPESAGQFYCRFASVQLSTACPLDRVSPIAAKREIRRYLYGRTRRSTPVASRIRLEISSIENSVVSTCGMRYLENSAAAARSSKLTCCADA